MPNKSFSFCSTLYLLQSGCDLVCKADDALSFFFFFNEFQQKLYILK